MFGTLDVSTSALVANRQRLEIISANMAMANVAVDPSDDPDKFRRRMAVFAPGDPTSGSAHGVHVDEIMLDQAAFEKKYEPGHPYADDQGYVSYPNIEPTMEMINALEASRAYEANITAAEATKRMLQTSLRILA